MQVSEGCHCKPTRGEVPSARWWLYGLLHLEAQERRALWSRHSPPNPNQTMSTSPISPSKPRNFLADSDTDNDSESQRSISLSSPPDSSRNSAAYDAVDLDTEPVSSTPSATYYSYQPSTIPSDSSRTLTSLDSRDTSKYTTSSSGHSFDKTESVTYPVNDSLRSYNVVDPPPASATSTSFSPDTSYARPPSPPALPTYPPTSNDTDSVLSFASTSSRKARPESMLIIPPEGPLVLGVALVDFNHLVSTSLSQTRVPHLPTHLW